MGRGAYAHAPPQHLLLATAAAGMLRRQEPWSDLQSPLCSFFSLPHHFSLPLSASQPFILPRYSAYGKSSFHTYLPHCHSKLASYTCSSNLSIWPSQILLFKCSSTLSTLFCHACAEGWDSNTPQFLLVFSLLLSILLPLLTGWAHSLQRSASACVMLGNSMMQDVMEPGSPHGFMKQQLDKFRDEKCLKVIRTGTGTHS